MSRRNATLDVRGTKVDVTNLDKIFYPAVGFTKGDVIDYYVKISEVLLPHLKKRPISLKRYPNGVEGKFFYEKECPSYRPKWMKTTRVGKKDGGEVNYCVIEDLPALIWAANIADLELHTFLHRAPALARPTAVAFDLDPGDPADIVQCCQVGLWIRAITDALGLNSYPKTSGAKGLQVYIPLNTPTAYEQTKEFALTVARLLEQEFPKIVISRMQRSARKGKIFVDWSQNDAKKTTVNAYSLRAKSTPTVSTPIMWDEVAAAWKKKIPLSFDTKQVLDRVEQHGDLFAPVLTLKQKLPSPKIMAELAVHLDT